ncbi:Protein of unknown function [Gryllus bimaculatus]|nr:Protein of unknown function [Gryllus bimaculatus]
MRFLWNGLRLLALLHAVMPSAGLPKGRGLALLAASKLGAALDGFGSFAGTNSFRLFGKLPEKAGGGGGRQPGSRGPGAAAGSGRAATIAASTATKTTPGHARAAAIRARVVAAAAGRVPAAPSPGGGGVQRPAAIARPRGAISSGSGLSPKLSAGPRTYFLCAVVTLKAHSQT